MRAIAEEVFAEFEARGRTGRPVHWRLAKADVTIWRHHDDDRTADLAELEQLVARSSAPVLVVADTVFSMDGDVLDVGAVADICRRHGALLVLDEAHAVLGPHPTADQLDGVEVVRVGTLSKTLGALGGFAACSARVADLLVNTARPSMTTWVTSSAVAAYTAVCSSAPVPAVRTPSMAIVTRSARCPTAIAPAPLQPSESCRVAAVSSSAADQ